MNLLDLQGRTALITGAGQGVGRQIALLFAQNNCGGVIVNDYFADRAAAVAEEVRQLGGKAIAAQADVTDLPSVRGMVAQGLDAFGRIDILVNNAGNAGPTPWSAPRTPFWELGPETWSKFVDVNFYGVVNCVSACAPGMIERKSGRIITIISDASRTGDAGMEIYAGAKAGAAGFMRAVARTLGRYMITANCVSIAATLTPDMEQRLESDPERYRKLMERYVIRRPGRPQDAANMVLYLASEASSWITGQTYPVNGGYSFAL
jgi:2-hydroxycyclohexanecarboxyl-CoA dehydrogenase